MNEPSTSDASAPDRVECPASKDPPVRMFAVAAMLIAFGVYCAYDAFLATEDGEPKYSSEKNAASYYFNAVGGVVLPPVGIVALICGLVMLRRKFVADQEGLGYVGKEKVPWSRVSKLVKRGAGRLDVSYDGPGEEEEGVLELDSWKLKHFAELVAFIDAKAPDVPVEEVKKGN